MYGTPIKSTGVGCTLAIAEALATADFLAQLAYRAAAFVPEKNRIDSNGDRQRGMNLLNAILDRVDPWDVAPGAPENT
jgi:hypothetical protein